MDCHGDHTKKIILFWGVLEKTFKLFKRNHFWRYTMTWSIMGPGVESWKWLVR